METFNVTDLLDLLDGIVKRPLRFAECLTVGELLLEFSSELTVGKPSVADKGRVDTLQHKLDRCKRVIPKLWSPVLEVLVIKESSLEQLRCLEL